MSRYQEWTSAETGLGNFASKYIELDVRCQKGKSDKYYVIEMRKLINEFSKMFNIQGSYTERVLKISNDNYKAWTNFIIEKSLPLTPPTL